MYIVTRLFSILIILFCFRWDAIAKPDIELTSDKISLTDFSMSYYIDQTGRMPFESIKQQTFTPSTNKLALGTKAKTTWSKVVIQNTTQQNLALNLHHPYAYHNHKIEFYQENNGILINSLLIDLDNPNDYQSMYGGTAIYPFIIKAGSQNTFYINTVSYSHQWFTLSILDTESSKRALVGNQNDIAILVGILFALMLYNFLLYVSSRKRENILYSLYLISGTIWIALSYGLLANFFGLYGDAVMKLHITLITMPIFLILFMISIFESKHKYPTEHKVLMGLMIILVADFIYGLIDIKAALEPASSIAALMMLLTLSVCISILRKGNPLAKLFLIGHSLFIGFNVMAVLYYKGLADFMYITCYGVGIGIALEALMLAFILSYRIKLLEKLKASQEELKYQAATDSMTQLFNRRYFNDNACQLVQKCRQDKQTVSVIIVDIDNFKRINDTYGHQTGDKVIIHFANILKSSVRKQDLVARYGGEEFVLLLTDCDQRQASQIAEKIRYQVEKSQLALASGDILSFTVSLGISAVENNDKMIENALSRADKALYQAKNNGRNQICKYSESALSPVG
ncbi:sensor domain-containing diguanylate cyclase [Catenovulum sp. 2E275]|uniref:sensor domain-containing diguanylate cyclase n=1 Tax=Catenovulum sp. 2E275 TaxID=2980497 RepID=UPI0021CF15C1|nr:diguanylate cyclase [Catenovulum sp. 2E275]MCU4675674.1 sensor domain-containing diguanylate cyclase [Catenovulum sp. 2E275]